MTNDEIRMTKRIGAEPTARRCCSAFVIRHSSFVILLAFCLSACACAPYRLRGIVVSGPEAAIRVVAADDPVLRSFGLANAVLEVTTEPNSMSPQRVAAASTDERGQFDVELDLTGAGVLEHEVGLFAQAPGYGSAWQTMKLPGRNRRLLVVLPAGGRSTPPGDDAVRESLEIHRQMQQAR